MTKQLYGRSIGLLCFQLREREKQTKSRRRSEQSLIMMDIKRARAYVLNCILTYNCIRDVACSLTSVCAILRTFLFTAERETTDKDEVWQILIMMNV